jgi:hypothetical protein
MEIIGGGFPVHPLKDVATALVASNIIELSETPASPSAYSVHRQLEFKTLAYEKETPETKHVHALQMGCYAQSQLAQHSVVGVIAAITSEHWVNGVYVLFEAGVSRVFYETFATSLHGKAGGVNVLVNSAQRMLAVQLGDRNKDRQRKPMDTHLLVKVTTDGRFTIGHTPNPTQTKSNAAMVKDNGAANGAAANGVPADRAATNNGNTNTNSASERTTSGLS